MAEGGGNEKQFLGKYVQKQTKYGTTTKLAPKSTTYIKHKISETDTMMGIALKYGITVEQLKRENKLWTNDSLFLREHLLVPVAREDIATLPDDLEVVDVDPRSRSRSGSQISNSSRKSTESGEHGDSTNNGVSVEPKTSPLDFLNKYDSNIAQLKSNMEKMENNARLLNKGESDNPLTFLPRKTKNGARRHSGSAVTVRQLDAGKHNSEVEKRKTNSMDCESSPVLLIKSRNKTRQVQTSLEKQEQVNDELFEL
ncbi:lysM and putative peptidoglycan-binding domain-containing protein 1-like [Ylistrum balloti]|uniref:lysM and putative peptidoglycan-binding domain-containing protein 1-like n=1 Tax=Ylistrum balloti TaxID=509963 RepID=UPI002905C167|nr:lysM and putative peptidoglycan-binding domain-containing protein 1-like [Ylistrum balloti]